MRPNGNTAELEWRRWQAIALLEQGMWLAQVTRAIGTTRTP
ncbi:MAG: hypothetical protein HJJLKODD_00057 [Phycisphaerae bacterium]|nr:hypothetical protein [Phycisphaerae bacterium]